MQRTALSVLTPRGRVILTALPVMIVLALTLWWTALEQPQAMQMRPITENSAQALASLFEEAGYAWAPTGPVPRLALQQLPSDMADLTVDDRKALFFASIAPLVLAENERIRQERARLEQLLSRSARSPTEQAEFEALADRYAVSGDLTAAQTRQLLLQRVDTIPLGLALAQAAKESGWGTSRFVQQGRNLFGVWTWDESQGMVPTGRMAGATHLVRVFPDLQASVRNYLHMLNTGAAYASLRRARAELRAAGEPLDPLLLADGLKEYSECGEAYVQDVRAMILNNELHQLGKLTLAP